MRGTPAVWMIDVLTEPGADPMSMLSEVNETMVAEGRAGGRSLPAVYLQLAKARLTALVLVTTAVGFIMASGPVRGLDWLTLLWTILGTALTAAAANALNQLVEARRDGLMLRTRDRPLPTGAIGPAHCLIFALVSAAVGLAVLAALVNPIAAGLALLTILVYILLYTPLKTVSTVNTLVGAVCGAIPPLIGWVAAAGTIEPGGWILAGLLFVWQIPHFFALCWLYRRDYARGGFVMLPVVDRSGALTCRVIVLTSLALLPLGLAVTLWGHTGWVYAMGSIVLGLWLLSYGTRLFARPNEANARRLFLATIIYLPLLLCLMVVGRSVAGELGSVAQAAGTVATATE